MNCPKCGAPRNDERAEPSGWQRPSGWKCGSRPGSMVEDARTSKLCREREEHIKTRAKLAWLESQMDIFEECREDLRSAEEYGAKWRMIAGNLAEAIHSEVQMSGGYGADARKALTEYEEACPIQETEQEK